MNKCLMEACNIEKEYGTVVKTKALKGVTLGFAPGEFASLIGFSGSGKTTLLNILGALDVPSAGKLYFDGQEVTAMGEQELARFRNRNLGFIFQFHHLLPEFTVMENILIPTWISSGRTGREREKRAEELLDLVGLKGLSGRMATELSGGQQQRVAIARSLINEPMMVLADEPTGNLDSETTEAVYSLMRDINRQLNTAFLVVTHNDHIAAKSDRVIQMKDGLVIRDYLTAGKTDDENWMEVAPPYCKLCQDKDSVLR